MDGPSNGESKNNIDRELEGGAKSNVAHNARRVMQKTDRINAAPHQSMYYQQGWAFSLLNSLLFSLKNNASKLMRQYFH